MSAAGAAVTVWPSIPERVAYYQLIAGGITDRLTLLGLVGGLLALSAVARNTRPRWLAPSALVLGVVGAGVNAVLTAPVILTARSLGHEISLSDTSVSSEDPEVIVFGDARLEADLYRPRRSTVPAPAIVVVHGGAWRHGDKGENIGWNHWLADHGALVLDIQYRLAPDANWHQQLADIRAAIDWIRTNADTLNADPERIALLGRSAGGHLALLFAYTADVSDTPISKVVALYAPTDLARLYAEAQATDVRDGVEALIGGPPDVLEAEYRLASPLYQAHTNVPPTLVIHGTWDDLVPADHSQQLAMKLASRGVPAKTLTIPYARHAFDIVGNGPASQLARQPVADFLSLGLGTV